MHGFINKWTYYLRTVPNNADILQPLENAIRQNLTTCYRKGKCFRSQAKAVFSPSSPGWS